MIFGERVKERYNRVRVKEEEREKKRARLSGLVQPRRLDMGEDFWAAKSDKESGLGWNTCDAKEKSHHPLFQPFFFFAFTLTLFCKE